MDDVTGRPVRIASFNLHHGAPPHRWFSRRGLTQALQRLGADLVALQEVDRRVVRSCWSDQAELCGRAAGLHPTFVPARRLGPFGRYGIALLTPGPPSAVEVLRLPRFGGEQRVALLASVEVRGQRVTVAATHLQNDEAIAARQLDVVLDRLAGRPGPHLLLGDLNAGPDRLGTRVAAAGLTPVAAAPTFPTWAPRERIDWIAMSGTGFDRVEVPSIWLSDHFPLVAQLTPNDGPGR